MDNDLSCYPVDQLINANWLSGIGIVDQLFVFIWQNESFVLSPPSTLSTHYNPSPIVHQFILAFHLFPSIYYNWNNQSIFILRHPSSEQFIIPVIVHLPSCDFVTLLPHKLITFAPSGSWQHSAPHHWMLRTVLPILLIWQHWLINDVALILVISAYEIHFHV